MTSEASPALSVVMPVYNEEGSISSVLAEWTSMLDQVVPDYEIRVYDDGSRDGSGRILQSAAAVNPRIVAVTHTNRGHGPTLMRGYLEATGEWIFQTDSDGEMPAAEFPALWARRDEFDFVLGGRQGRHSTAHRKVLTGGSRLVTAALFGRRVRDVNSPYRLMRGSWLRPQLARIPAGAAVPNIIISGLAARTGARILELPVRHTNRRTGSTSLNFKRISRLALRAVGDSIQVALSRQAR